MTVLLPAEITSRRVVARYLNLVADGPEDPDDLPDGAVPTGDVRFTRVTDGRVWADTTQSDGTTVRITKGPIVARIDPATGEIGLAHDPAHGVKLPVGLWSVVEQVAGRPAKPWVLDVTPGEGVIDLHTQAPVVPTPTTVLVPSLETMERAEAAVAEAEEARDQTRALRDTVQEIAGLTGEDEAVALLVNDTSSQTARALRRPPGELRKLSGLGTTTSAPARTAALTIIDDDGNAAVMSRLRPILAARGVPGSCAIITGSVGKARVMDWPQIETLLSEGWEMLGHGHEYTSNLTEHSVSDGSLQADFETCRSLLLDHGADPVGFVYPQSASNPAIRAAMRDHFAFSFAGAGIASQPVATDAIVRIAFGSWTSSNPTVRGNREKSTLAYFQACVDEAVATDSWLVLMTHISAQPAAADTLLGEVLDYAIAQGMPVITPTEGYRMHGNRLWAGDSGGQWVAVNDQGIYGSDVLPLTLASDNSPSAMADPLGQPLGISMMRAWGKYPSTHSLPGTRSDRAGTLTTTRSSRDTTFPDSTVQEYRTNGGLRYARRGLPDGSGWGAWVAVTPPTTHHVLGTNAHTASDPPSAYAQGVTICANDIPAGAGFPNNKAGITTTTKAAGEGWDRQEWRPHNANGIWSRYSVAGDTWSEWEPLLAP